jgi:Skp family chaperone for outer membrane proteins
MAPVLSPAAAQAAPASAVATMPTPAAAPVAVATMTAPAATTAVAASNVATMAAAASKPTNGHDVSRIKVEVQRLEGLVKKLQTELQAEREYSRALEAHIKTLQESQRE